MNSLTQNDGMIQASGLTALTRLGKGPRLCPHERNASSSLPFSAGCIDLLVSVHLGIQGLIKAMTFKFL